MEAGLAGIVLTEVEFKNWIGEEAHMIKEFGLTINLCRGQG